MFLIVFKKQMVVKIKGKFKEVEPTPAPLSDLSGRPVSQAGRAVNEKLKKKTPGL